MASTRLKKGKWYYRITLSSNGERKYIERGSFDTEQRLTDPLLIVRYMMTF